MPYYQFFQKTLIYFLFMLLLLFNISNSRSDPNRLSSHLKNDKKGVGSNKGIPAVIIFGDSIVDTGNNNYIKTIFKVNYPPYGKDFPGSIPTGRFCNGKVPSDFIVEELGIKELLPPYLQPNLGIEELRTGVNFASGGGGYDPLTSQLASVISLPKQLELFKEYIDKVKSKAGVETSNKILSEGLFMVVTGSNDIAITYNNPLRKPHFDFDSYAQLLVNSASSFLKNLYAIGARRIGVFGVPPVGCLPAQRTLVGGTQRKCAENYNQLAILFNTKLSKEIASLTQNLPFSRMIFVDVYYLSLHIIQNPTTYGFGVSNLGCCGSGAIELAFFCKTTCTNVSDYVFWDSFHFTDSAYKIMVREVLKKNLDKFLVP